MILATSLTATTDFFLTGFFDLILSVEMDSTVSTNLSKLIWFLSSSITEASEHLLTCEL
jgi:hypothetical protein